jgi:hypothetical protein
MRRLHKRLKERATTSRDFTSAVVTDAMAQAPVAISAEMSLMSSLGLNTESVFNSQYQRVRGSLNLFLFTI